MALRSRLHHSRGILQIPLDLPGQVLGRAAFRQQTSASISQHICQSPDPGGNEGPAVVPGFKERQPKRLLPLGGHHRKSGLGPKIKMSGARHKTQPLNVRQMKAGGQLAQPALFRAGAGNQKLAPLGNGFGPCVQENLHPFFRGQAPEVEDVSLRMGGGRILGLQKMGNDVHPGGGKPHSEMNVFLIFTGRDPPANLVKNVVLPHFLENQSHPTADPMAVTPAAGCPGRKKVALGASLAGLSMIQKITVGAAEAVVVQVVHDRDSHFPGYRIHRR